MLEQLASRYGLPQDSKYEVAYCSVLAPERFSEARARAVLLDWVSSSLRQGVRSVKKVFLPGNPVLVSQVGRRQAERQEGREGREARGQESRAGAEGRARPTRAHSYGCACRWC